MKVHEVRIKSYIDWNIISWRTTWNKIKNDFLKYYEMWIKIDLNFEWIESTTHSFIDELIWAFVFYDVEKALWKIKFSNCNENVKSVIKFVVYDRSANSLTK